MKFKEYLAENNSQFASALFRAQDEANGDPMKFKKLAMKFTGLTPRGFKKEMEGPFGRTLLIKGKPANTFFT